MITPRHATGPLLRALLGAAALTLCACGTTPATRFYTLMPARLPQAPAATPGYAIEVLPVSLPEQVDVPQLVLRRGDGELALVETRQWAGPLADELRAALSAQLRARLGVRDVHRLAVRDALPVRRIKLDVLRFESVLGGHALLDAGWSVAGEPGALATCVSTVRVDAPGDWAELTRAHQQALAQVAGQIAGVLAATAQDAAARCPG